MLENIGDLNTEAGQSTRTPGKILRGVLKTVAVLGSIAVTVAILLLVLTGAGTAASTATGGKVADAAIMDRFDMYMTNGVSNALDGVLKIDKVYWLSDSDLVAPEPNPENFGTVDSPAELMWLLEEAAELIDGQEMLFNENTPEWEEEKIYYYYDETILVIIWKQIINKCTYTFAEVKIAHPSQFRRFLANGEFGSEKQFITTDMAKTVNAVVASSGDFYQFRQLGVVVYGNEIKRAEYNTIDTCFINDKGDLLLTPKGTFKNDEEAQKFVEENNVRFSLAFGPILIDDGVVCPPDEYKIGEVKGRYTRAALCQRDELHYVLVNAGSGPGNFYRHTMKEFAEQVALLGCDKAYALDGGQTSVIAIDGELLTCPDFGHQRRISDIIYFATALPDGE